MANVAHSAVVKVLCQVDKVHLLDTMMTGTAPFNKRLEQVITEILDATVRCHVNLVFHDLGTENQGVY